MMKWTCIPSRKFNYHRRLLRFDIAGYWVARSTSYTAFDLLTLPFGDGMSHRRRCVGESLQPVRTSNLSSVRISPLCLRSPLPDDVSEKVKTPRQDWTTTFGVFRLSPERKMTRCSVASGVISQITGRLARFIFRQNKTRQPKRLTGLLFPWKLRNDPPEKYFPSTRSYRLPKFSIRLLNMGRGAGSPWRLSRFNHRYYEPSRNPWQLAVFGCF